VGGGSSNCSGGSSSSSSQRIYSHKQCQFFSSRFPSYN
jgi:hypothetical protein